MTDPKSTDVMLDGFSDLPIQPTGSGVADLEIAYEQMKLAEDAAGASAHDTGGEGIAAANVGDEAAESAAHPS